MAMSLLVRIASRPAGRANASLGQSLVARRIPSRGAADVSHTTTTPLPSIPPSIALPPSGNNIRKSLRSPDIKLASSTYTPDPLIDQVVNNIMKHGKKSLARRLVSDALLYIRKKADSADSPRTLLAKAVDMAAPLVKMVSTKRGSRTIHSPRPISDHVRHRIAILWIVEAAASRGKGKPFAERFGNEVLAVLNGESSALQKKLNLHRMALSNRSNVLMNDRRIS
ncbi:hypothetical protein SeLEV6574_g03780 [Synchytrium endobioticum]|uniref:Small ribosomal subunit protein uS7 domain-containing protein n=1 Tax=Synchytrium endobioticum TaxID=286115 RepID=A0A507D2Z8_9FUNG|nr:hypothetical protein SeLEV6574_g03780 [Synchytrium endobioticum]